MVHIICFQSIKISKYYRFKCKYVIILILKCFRFSALPGRLFSKIWPSLLDEKGRSSGFWGKGNLGYNRYIWISHFSKLEFFNGVISYIKHHNLKSIKIIDENVFKKWLTEYISWAKYIQLLNLRAAWLLSWRYA